MSEDFRESLRRLLAFNSRDWAQDRADAWLWGVVLGWDADENEVGEESAMDEVAARHGWDASEVARLRRLHAQFAAPDSTPTEREAGDVGEVAAVLAAHVTRVGPISGAWHCPCGATSSNGDIREGNLTSRAERTTEFITHVAESLAPLIAERERAAGARALREAADAWETDVTDPTPRTGAHADCWLRERADTYAEGGEHCG
ncbi:hypothetical protein [Nocardioides panaciterrulae]|uniref:Uncharacterized protein n=1 Tax=Nocardioides panaciterrulae TaxID=661492 RepID=A0A7Y9EAD7_9ACTN|nr:hypothetical protein [Nocardioides panaciterrulae]NYD39920.1 hypothetical protein [Nocardioides panaciterrulae]NYD43952.1 hypothetical protein [Nocardioides panaciterrulae]